MSQRDEQAITSAAAEAVNDLQLDCRVEKVFRHPRNNNRWCIQFSGDYGQFCDEFRNEAGEGNSPRLMREKVKSYFLKKRRPVRVRKGSRSQAERERQESGLLSAPLEVVGQAIGQTTRLVGEVVNQVSDLARSALDTEASLSVELPAVAMPTPAPRKSRRAARTSTRKSVKKSSGKPSRKASSSRAAKRSAKSSKSAKKSGRKKRQSAASIKRSSKKRR
jgi:hypothetical protein